MPSSASLKAGSAGGIIAPAHGACSSMAESLTVDQVVVGSTPIRHPKRPREEGAFVIKLCPQKGRLWVRPHQAPFFYPHFEGIFLCTTGR